MLEEPGIRSRRSKRRHGELDRAALRFRQKLVDHLPYWRLTRGQKTHTVKVRGSLSSNDGEILTKWALDAHGVVLRAEWDIAKYLRTGRLELALEDYEAPPADVYAVYHERHHVSAKVKEFIDFLITWFRPSQAGNGKGLTW